MFLHECNSRETYAFWDSNLPFSWALFRWEAQCSCGPTAHAYLRREVTSRVTPIFFFFDDICGFLPFPSLKTLFPLRFQSLCQVPPPPPVLYGSISFDFLRFNYPYSIGCFPLKAVNIHTIWQKLSALKQFYLLCTIFYVRKWGVEHWRARLKTSCADWTEWHHPFILSLYENLKILKQGRLSLVPVLLRLYLAAVKLAQKAAPSVEIKGLCQCNTVILYSI